MLACASRTTRLRASQVRSLSLSLSQVRVDDLGGLGTHDRRPHNNRVCVSLFESILWKRKLLSDESPQSASSDSSLRVDRKRDARSQVHERKKSVEAPRARAREREREKEREKERENRCGFPKKGSTRLGGTLRKRRGVRSRLRALPADAGVVPAPAR